MAQVITCLDREKVGSFKLELLEARDAETVYRIAISDNGELIRLVEHSLGDGKRLHDLDTAETYFREAVTYYRSQ